MWTHVKQASSRFMWAPLLAVTVATVTISIALYYSGQPLLEDNAWRQTQTALTSYWMLKEGWQLAYQTPVLGYPWEIPLEFPIFQTIVAFVVWLADLPLDPTGRNRQPDLSASLCVARVSNRPEVAIAARGTMAVLRSLVVRSNLYL